MSDVEMNIYDISQIKNLPDSVNCKNVEKNEYNSYTMYNYKNSKFSDEVKKSIGLFRSVIARDDKVLSFSPPKSLSFEGFKQENADYEQVIAEEFVEGTMINLFYDEKKEFPKGCEDVSDNNKWEITTKSVIGAGNNIATGDNKFTFRHIFLDAMIASGLEFSHLNKSCCYSFVVQHPKNRIVKIVTQPHIFLIAVYKIEGHTVTDVTKEESVTISDYVKIPERYQFSSYEEAQEKYASMETYYDVVGIIFKNRSGNRTKLRNPIYEKVKHLRGSDLKLQFQYMALRQIGKVGNYLKFYPEHADSFSKFRDDIHRYTRNLHKNYISCYIKKEKPLVEYDFEYKTHMFKLHEYYINELRTQGKNVSMHQVVQYVNSLHPAKLMYTLNQPLHKQRRDIVKKELEEKKNVSSEEN